MTRRDPVTGMTDKELAALADQAYADRDDAEAWDDMGAPEVSPEVRSVVSVRFSRGELGTIAEAAGAAGVPVSTYIRNAAINAVSTVDVADARRRAEALQGELEGLIGALRADPRKDGKRARLRNRRESAA
jgi:hypothetical protein